MKKALVAVAVLVAVAAIPSLAGVVPAGEGVSPANKPEKELISPTIGISEFRGADSAHSVESALMLELRRAGLEPVFVGRLREAAKEEIGYEGSNADYFRVTTKPGGWKAPRFELRNARIHLDAGRSSGSRVGSASMSSRIWTLTLTADLIEVGSGNQSSVVVTEDYTDVSAQADVRVKTSRRNFSCWDIFSGRNNVRVQSRQKSRLDIITALAGKVAGEAVKQISGFCMNPE